MRCAPVFFLALPAAFALELGSTGRKASLAKRLERLTDAALQRYTYKNFVNDFHRDVSSSEWPERERVFRANLAKVVALRANPDMTWVPSVTKFMDYHTEEFDALLGYKGRRARAGASGGTRKQSVGGVGNVPVGPVGSGWGAFSNPVALPVYPPVPGYPTVPGYPQVPGYSQAPGATPAQGAQGAAPREHLSDDTAPHSFSVFGRPNTTSGFVRDQGRCGSCWAEAALTVMEGAIDKDWQLVGAIRKIGMEPRLSRDQAIACAKNPWNCGGTGQCDGATAEMAFRLAREDGLVLQQDTLSVAEKDGVAPQCQTEGQGGPTPFPKIFIDAYTTLPKNRPHLKGALIAQGSPIAVVVDASNWKLYSSGVYSDTNSGSEGEFTVNHVVALMGYDTGMNPSPYYLIKNSWGPEWGESGFIRLELKDDEQNHCGWDRQAHLGTACDGDPDKAWVCGTCGILFDASFPSGIRLVGAGS